MLDQPMLYLPFAPPLLAAALCARAANDPLETWPPPDFADALWMRDAAEDDIARPPPFPPDLFITTLLSKNVPTPSCYDDAHCAHAARREVQDGLTTRSTSENRS